MEDGTGLDAYSLLQHVLVGAEPVFRRVDIKSKDREVQLPTGRVLKRRAVTVEVRGPLSFREMRSLRARVNGEFEAKRKKDLNINHLKVLALVREAGPPATKRGVVAYWRRRQQEYNDRKDDAGKRYTTWQGVKAAYDRAIAAAGRGLGWASSGRGMTKAD